MKVAVVVIVTAVAVAAVLETARYMGHIEAELLRLKYRVEDLERQR